MAVWPHRVPSSALCRQTPASFRGRTQQTKLLQPLLLLFESRSCTRGSCYGVEISTGQERLSTRWPLAFVLAQVALVVTEAVDGEHRASRADGYLGGSNPRLQSRTERTHLRFAKLLETCLTAR